jgi:hypothetical protein
MANAIVGHADLFENTGHAISQHFISRHIKLAMPARCMGANLVADSVPAMAVSVS